MAGEGPPAYAWDWCARQRLVWQEARRRLAVAPPTPARPSRTAGDVPDWSAEHPDLRPSDPAPSTAPLRRDYRALGTRAEVVAALREDYPQDPQIRAIVDAVVGDLAFLGRLDASLEDLGVRSAPRGMRWWWSHLTGTPAILPRSRTMPPSEAREDVPAQLRLVDVLAGYGDVPGR
jgi:hypothetical protein